MAEKETARRILKETEQRVSLFVDGIPSTQNGILRRINGILRDLEVNAGIITPNTANIALLRNLRDELQDIIITKSYLGKVESYLRGFSLIKGINDTYFKDIAKTFNPNKFVFKEILKSSIDLTKNSLTQSGINQFVIEPIVDIVNNGITSGSLITDMEESLRTVIVGDDKRLGGLERYSKQITRDALNQYSANYNNSVANDLGLEFYYYSGGVIEDTRSYCVKRAGQYFHIKEIEQVPASWSGRIPGTNSSNILKNRGGYNCRHQYQAVLSRVVPKSVRDRAEKKGFYKP